MILNWENLQMGKPVQICLSHFQPGGVQLLVLFVNGHVGLSLAGKICRWESRLKSAQAISSRGVCT